MSQNVPTLPAQINFPAYYEQVQSSRVIRSAGDPDAFVGVMRQLENPIQGSVCDLLPQDKFTFLEGDTTLWAGINGHGKSLVVGQVISGLMMRNERCFLMSLEMPPRYTFLRMMRQAFGRSPTKADEKIIRQWFNFAATRLVYFDKVGCVAPVEVLGAMAYAAEVYRCKHLVIDNLMRVVAGEDDYNAQKEFVRQCCEIAMTFNCHVHLVHHVRKGEKETDEIGKFSIRGASSIADQASNIILIQRNLDKERKREEGRLSQEDDEDNPDVLLNVAKHRNGDWQGRQKLWFCPASAAYSTSPSRTVPRLWNGETENLEDIPF